MILREMVSWEQFESELKPLRACHRSRSSPLLFRGQGDCRWRLDTTLERINPEPLSFGAYFRLITGAIRPAVETFTERNWEAPDYSLELELSFREYDGSKPFFHDVELYRYMVYLRHHGFPSPLLDWSHSPYVAAFFAFREPVPSVEKRSIYVFCEAPTGGKGSNSSEPRIDRRGPYVRSHKRHFRQQSDYTMCSSWDAEWQFAPHEDVFAKGATDQDSLWKFDLPSSERAFVLRMLDEYNLNAYSLFDSEDTLMETLSMREFVLGGNRPSAEAPKKYVHPNSSGE